MRLPLRVPVHLPIRLHFQETPWDITGIVAYTLAVSSILLAAGVGDLLAILLVVLAPGYMLVALLFPSGSVLDWIERLVLSFGASTVVLALVGLALAVSPVGLDLVSLVVALLGFTVGVGLGAYLRRIQLPVEERLRLDLRIDAPRWRGETAVDRIITLAIAASIVAAAGALAYAVLTPPAGEHFTELYLLGPSGNATGYPKNLTVSEPAAVYVGVVNHETRTMNYSVRVDLAGIQIVHNATSGYNVTVELNRTTLTWLNTTLSDGGMWTQRFAFSVGSAGTWELQFLLYKNGILSTAEAHLILFVT